MGLLDFFRKKSGPEKALEDAFGQIAKQMSAQDDLFELLKQTQGIDSNTKINTDGPSNPNYGLCPENPVFVKGPSGTDSYLARLKTTSGQKLTWDRNGSTKADGVPGCTDIYSGCLEDGSHYITIYVNWYGDKNSSSAPEGLTL